MLNLRKKIKSSEQTGSSDIRVVVRFPVLSENELKEDRARSEDFEQISLFFTDLKS